jgi:hypothetical protein
LLSVTWVRSVYMCVTLDSKPQSNIYDAVTATTTRRAQFTRHTAGTSSIVLRPPGTAQTVAHRFTTPGVTCPGAKGIIIIVSGNGVLFVGLCTNCENM